MRGLTSTIALVVVLAGLGAYIYFVDSKKRPAAGGVDGEGQGLHRRGGQDRGDHASPRTSETSALQEGRRHLADDGAGRRPTRIRRKSSSLTTNLAGLEVNRVVDENAADLGAVRPGGAARSASRSRARTAPPARSIIGDKHGDAERCLRRQARREARLPGAGVPGNVVQQEAVRPARQAHPHVRARQDRSARDHERDGTSFSWRAPAASGA